VTIRRHHVYHILVVSFRCISPLLQRWPLPVFVFLVVYDFVLIPYLNLYALFDTSGCRAKRGLLLVVVYCMIPLLYSINCGKCQKYVNGPARSMIDVFFGRAIGRHASDSSSPAVVSLGFFAFRRCISPPLTSIVSCRGREAFLSPALRPSAPSNSSSRTGHGPPSLT